ncbi:MAG: LamG domain-containing protein [Polyangiaceae bacterium]
MWPSAQYVDLTDGLIQDCTTNLTVAAWVNLETNNNMASVFTVAPDGSALIHFGTAYKKDADLTLQMNWNTSSWATARAPQVWQLGQWYHVAGVRAGTGTTAQVYVNGMPLTLVVNDYWANANRSYADWGVTPMNYFGRSRDELGQPGFDGTLDEILISCRAYTASEIAQLAYRP